MGTRPGLQRALPFPTDTLRPLKTNLPPVGTRDLSVGVTPDSSHLHSDPPIVRRRPVLHEPLVLGVRAETTKPYSRPSTPRPRPS